MHFLNFEYLILLYIAMVFLQTIHIFEEIAMKAYELAGSLSKYLRVASILVFLSYLGLVLLLLGTPFGPYLALFNTFIAMGNGFIHVFGYVKTGSYRGTLGAGVFSGVPLGIVGGLVFAQLVMILN